MKILQKKGFVPKYKLIVFDWDGTLYDSGAHIVHCVQYAAQDANVGPLDEKLIRGLIGLNYERVLDKLIPHRTKEQEALFTERYYHYLETATNQPVLFPETEKILQELKSLDYWLAIATGKSRRDLKFDLSRLNLQDYFMASRCGDEVCSKPHPQMLLEILTEMGVAPAEALMIGDTEYDLQMANNAGVDALAATYGLQDEARLSQQKIVGHLSDISQLPEWLGKS